MSERAGSDGLELRRTRIDLLKHFTTLNAGTIVTASALFEKLGRPFYGRRALVLAFLFLFMSPMLCIASLMKHEHLGRDRACSAVFQLVGYLFISGIGCLAVFSVSNLQLL
jgi:hypothetical protein